MLPILIMLLVGWRAASPPRTVEVTPSGSRSLLLGAAAGATGGLILAALAVADHGRQRPLDPGQRDPRPRRDPSVRAGAGRRIAHPHPRRCRARGGGRIASRASRADRAFARGGIRRHARRRRCWSRSSVPSCATSASNVLEDVFFASGGLTPIGFAIVFALTAAGVYAWATRGERVRERVAAMPDDRRRERQADLVRRPLPAAAGPAAARRPAPVGGGRHRRPLRPARPGAQHRGRLRRPARPGLRRVLRGRRLHDRHPDLARLAGLQPRAAVLGRAAVRDHRGRPDRPHSSAPPSFGCAATTWPS